MLTGLLCAAQKYYHICLAYGVLMCALSVLLHFLFHFPFFFAVLLAFNRNGEKVKYKCIVIIRLVLVLCCCCGPPKEIKSNHINSLQYIVQQALQINILCTTELSEGNQLLK